LYGRLGSSADWLAYRPERVDAVAGRILNGYEELTYDALQRACSGDGAHVFPKVRVADVFPLENQTISPKHLSYALKAHFDFVVTDKDYRPRCAYFSNKN
jgi:Protein of unknown function (DUF2726)